MSWEKRVVWTEGMLLLPQHFQQQSRYFEKQIRQLLQSCGTELWGLKFLEIDKSYLSIGKFSIKRGAGIFRDGSIFNFPEVDIMPNAIDIDDNYLDSLIYLAIPIRRFSNCEFSRDENDLKKYRSDIDEFSVRDVTGHSSHEQLIEVSGYKLCLLTDKDDLSEFSCIPIAKIDNVSSSGAISLTSDFIAPSVNIKNNHRVKTFINELLNLIDHRISTLASRVSVSGKASTYEVTDFLMLQALNRYLPLITHYNHIDKLHPLELYKQLCMLIGEMATFIRADKMPNTIPDYEHEHLTPIFNWIIKELRQIFSVVLDQNSINIPLQEKKYGIYVGLVNDKTLFDSASFILAVGADISAEQVSELFPAIVKIGAVEQIKELVNVQLPGIKITKLAVAPREIPYQRNFSYFELIPSGQYWQNLSRSGGIAIHVGNNFPNLSMQLWAIRGSS